MRAKLSIFFVTFPLVMALDFVTKRWALSALAGGQSRQILGGLVPLTLAFNKGAAFGIHLGQDSRWFFVPVTILALVLLTVLFKQTSPRDRLRLLAISLVVSGAVGNLYDRLRWSRGVVDFVGPINLGFWDFPIFNMADTAITCGAIFLAFSFWMEEQEERRLHLAPAASEAAAEEPGGGARTTERVDSA